MKTKQSFIRAPINYKNLGAYNLESRDWDLLLANPEVAPDCLQGPVLPVPLHPDWQEAGRTPLQGLVHGR